MVLLTWLVLLVTIKFALIRIFTVISLSCNNALSPVTTAQKQKGEVRQQTVEPEDEVAQLGELSKMNRNFEICITLSCFQTLQR